MHCVRRTGVPAQLSSGACAPSVSIHSTGAPGAREPSRCPRLLCSRSLSLSTKRSLVGIMCPLFEATHLRCVQGCIYRKSISVGPVHQAICLSPSLTYYRRAIVGRSWLYCLRCWMFSCTEKKCGRRFAAFIILRPDLQISVYCRP